MKKPYLKCMGRRTFIRGAAGVTFALPFMPSLFSSKTSQAAVGDPRYFFFMRCGNGVQQKMKNIPGNFMEEDRFWPFAQGADVALTRDLLEKKNIEGRTCALNELMAHREDLLVLQGVAYHGWRERIAGCGHAEAGVRCFTASPPNGEHKNLARATDISFDWYLYDLFQKLDPWKPLILGSGVGSSYLGAVVSYRIPGTVERPQYNPWSVYKAIFGLGTNPQTDPEAERMALRQNSVNDFVRQELDDLIDPRKISTEDRLKLELHQDSIRDLELEMTSDCRLMDWERIQTDFEGKDDREIQKSALMERITKLHMDITALAFACDLKRNVSLQIGNGNDQTVYVNNLKFHWISHRIEGDGGFKEGETKVIQNADVLHHEVDRIFAKWFGYFIDQLKARQVLDKTVAVWTNDIANGNHQRWNLPYVIAGSGGGYLKTGRMIDFNPDEKTSGSNKWETHDRLFNTFANAMGARKANGALVDDFGKDIQNGEIAAIKKV